MCETTESPPMPESKIPMGLEDDMPREFDAV
jgi:hypothetical protein